MREKPKSSDAQVWARKRNWTLRELESCTAQMACLRREFREILPHSYAQELSEVLYNTAMLIQDVAGVIRSINSYTILTELSEKQEGGD